MLRHQLGAVDTVFRDSDFDFEDPSVEKKTDMLTVECRKFYR